MKEVTLGKLPRCGVASWCECELMAALDMKTSDARLYFEKWLGAERRILALIQRIKEDV